MWHRRGPVRPLVRARPDHHRCRALHVHRHGEVVETPAHEAPEAPVEAPGEVAEEPKGDEDVAEPAETPAPIVDRLAQEFRAALAEPDLTNKFHDLGIEVWPGTATELSARMKSEIARWNKVVDDNAIERQ